MLKIDIDSRSAQIAVNRLEKDLKSLGRSTDKSSKEWKALENRLRSKVGADQAKRSIDGITRSLKMSRLETMRFKTSVGDLGGAFKTFGVSLGNIKNRIFSLQTAMLTLMGGYGLKRLAGSALDTAASFEQMEIKLETLTKGKGVETLEALNEWAMKMPVNTQKAVDSFTMMMAYGLNPTLKIMTTLVDVASIFGEDAMPRVARALGQIQARGKLSAQELMQLSEVGINATKYLTEAFSMSVEELQKSGIAIEKIVNVIWKGLSRDYGGAAEKAMTSWQGLTSIFKSYIVEIERSIMSAGVFDELKNQLEGVNTELEEWIDNNKDLIKQRVPYYVDRVKTRVEGLYKTYQSLPDNIIGATGLGLVGRMLLGGAGGAAIAAAYLAVVQFDKIFAYQIPKGDDERLKRQTNELKELQKQRQELLNEIDERMAIGLVSDIAYVEGQLKQRLQKINDNIKRVIENIQYLQSKEVIYTAKDSREGSTLSREGSTLSRTGIPKIIDESRLTMDSDMWAKGWGRAEKEVKVIIDRTYGYNQRQEQLLNAKGASEFIKMKKTTNDITIKQRMEAEQVAIEEIGKIEREALEESLRWQEEIYKNFLEGIQTNFVGFFEQLYSGNLNSWQDLVGSMKSTFIRMLAEITAKQFTANIVASVSGMGGSGGILGSIGKLLGIGGATGGTSALSSATTTSALGLGATAAGLGAVGLVGYMGYMKMQKDRERDARFLFTKMQYDGSPYDPETGLFTPSRTSVTKTPWEAYGKYTPGKGFTGPTEIIGKSYGRGSERGARKPVERAIDEMYEDAIEMANFYDKLTGGKVGKGFTLTPHKERFDIKNADKELRRLGEHWADIIWDVFEPTFEEMGFKSMEALARGIEKEKDMLGNAFQTALETGSWYSFKSSIAEQIYNTISEDLMKALIQSQVFQGAMLPVYGQINKAFEAASAGGGFDLGLFRQGISGVGGLLSTSFADLRPAFEEIANLGKTLREMFVGSFQHGGVVPQTGLAMVHEGETVSPQGSGLALTINADVITTDNVRGWIREVLEDQENYREGRPLQRFDLQTAGINVS